MTSNERSEADVLEQRREVPVEPEPEDTAELDPEANEADALEQHSPVAGPDDGEDEYPAG